MHISIQYTVFSFNDLLNYSTHIILTFIIILFRLIRCTYEVAKDILMTKTNSVIRNWINCKPFLILDSASINQFRKTRLEGLSFASEKLSLLSQTKSVEVLLPTAFWIMILAKSLLSLPEITSVTRKFIQTLDVN